MTRFCSATDEVGVQWIHIDMTPAYVIDSLDVVDMNTLIIRGAVWSTIIFLPSVLTMCISTPAAGSVLPASP